MPAEKFQTKNGGKNHGRWFYTCQMPQPKRCGFFLWEDEAKVREEGAVLSNSRTEPVEPRTPKKIGTRQSKLPVQIPTPPTKARSPVKLEAVPPPSSSADFGDWSDDDADLADALEEFETPRKAMRTSYNDSLTKQRNVSDKSDASSITLPHQDDTADVFTTPSTSKKPIGTDATACTLPPSPTPTPKPASTANAQSEVGELALLALTVLSPVSHAIPTSITDKLTALLNTHELRSSGIAKGRDIARLAIQTKERKITELEARIKGLEMEKETMRSVVGCLKNDIATSPKRPRRPRGSEGDETAGGGTGHWQGGREFLRGDKSVI